MVVVSPPPAQIEQQGVGEAAFCRPPIKITANAAHRASLATFVLFSGIGRHVRVLVRTTRTTTAAATNSSSLRGSMKGMVAR